MADSLIPDEADRIKIGSDRTKGFGEFGITPPPKGAGKMSPDDDQPSSLPVPRSSVEMERARVEVLTNEALQRAQLARKKGLREADLIDIQAGLEKQGIKRSFFAKSVNFLLGKGWK